MPAATAASAPAGESSTTRHSEGRIGRNPASPPAARALARSSSLALSAASSRPSGCGFPLSTSSPHTTTSQRSLPKALPSDAGPVLSASVLAGVDVTSASARGGGESGLPPPLPLSLLSSATAKRCSNSLLAPGSGATSFHPSVSLSSLSLRSLSGVTSLGSASPNDAATAAHASRGLLPRAAEAASGVSSAP